MTQESSEQLFESIALGNRLVTRYQISKAKKELELRRAKGQALNLGDVLTSLGFITERQLVSLQNALRYRETRNCDKRLARQLVRDKVCTAQVAEVELKRQKSRYEGSGETIPLSETLVEAEICTKEQAAAALDRIQTRDGNLDAKLSSEQRRSGPQYVHCDECNGKLLIKAHNLGRAVRCSACGHRFEALTDADRKKLADDPVVAELDDDDEVLDLEDIELDDGRDSDEDLGEVVDAMPEQDLDELDDGDFDELEDIPDDDDIDIDIDDLDEAALLSDELGDIDDGEDIDIDDLDEASLLSDDEELAPGVLHSDSGDELEFGDDDDDDLPPLEDDGELSDPHDELADLDEISSIKLGGGGAPSGSKAGSSSGLSLGDADPDELDDLDDVDLDALELEDDAAEEATQLHVSGLRNESSWVENAFDDRPLSARPKEPAPAIAAAPSSIPGAETLDSEIVSATPKELVPTKKSGKRRKHAGGFGSLKASTNDADVPGAYEPDPELERELAELGDVDALLDEVGEVGDLDELVPGPSAEPSRLRRPRETVALEDLKQDRLEGVDKVLPDSELFPDLADKMSSMFGAALAASEPTNGRSGSRKRESAAAQAATRVLEPASREPAATSLLPPGTKTYTDAQLRRAFDTAMRIAFKVFVEELRG